MTKEMAERLKGVIEEARKYLSAPFRANNKLQETFEVHDVIVTSEVSAWVIFQKYKDGQPTKKAGVWVLWNGIPFWFAPSESALYGMQNLMRHLMSIEYDNFPKNFEQPLAGGTMHEVGNA